MCTGPRKGVSISSHLPFSLFAGCNPPPGFPPPCARSSLELFSKVNREVPGCPPPSSPRRPYEPACFFLSRTSAAASVTLSNENLRSRQEVEPKPHGCDSKMPSLSLASTLPDAISLPARSNPSQLANFLPQYSLRFANQGREREKF